MAAAVDVGYLAASYSVPETTLHSLLSDPTTELVQALLVQIEAKAREFEHLQSDKLKADVELDNALQTGEQRARLLKAAADKAQKDADEQRQKLAEAETARKHLESQLHKLQTSTADSSTQIQSLESRIRDLESQNRDALATYDTKATAHDRLAQDLSDQHAKFVALRKQLSDAQDKIQSLESAASNVKFRETNLQQEIEMLRKNNDWYDAELKTRTADNSKFRKEKNAQVAELQRANADASETIESLRRTESLLRKHTEELKQKADEDQNRIQQLEDEAANQEANFRSELDNAKRLTALQQKTAETAKTRLEQLKAEYDSLQESAALEVGQLQADVELERNNAVEAEAKIANLESLIQDLEQQATQMKASAPVPATPRRPINGTFGTPGRAGSPAAFSPGGSMKGFVSNTMILTENGTLKEELRKLRNEDERKTTMISEMLEELQQVEPVMDELRCTNETLSTQIGDMSNDLEEALAEKDTARKDERKARGDLEGVQRECEQLRQHVQDLSVQLRSLIWRRQAEEEGLGALTPEQQQFITTSENNQLPADQSYGDTATDMLISQHLVLYKNVTDLQTQNASLLRTIREVAQQYEGDEARNQKAQQEKDQDELNKLRSRVLEYDEQVKSLSTRATSYKKERDMYRQVATSRGITLPDADATSNFGQSFNSQIMMTPLRGASSSHFVPQTPGADQIPGVDKLVKDLQSQVDVLKEESAVDRTTLKSQVDTLTKDNHQLQSEKLRLDSQLRREQDRCARLETSAKLHESEKTTLQERYHSIQTTLAKQDDRVVKAEQEVVDAIARAQGLEHELTNLKASQSMWQSIEARLTERNQELMDERDRLNKMVSHIQSIQNEQELTNTEKRRELQDRVSALEGELQAVRRKLEDEVAEHKKASLQRDFERTEAQKRIDDLIRAKNEADVRSASAETARQQLEQRVSELQSQLQNAEERVQALRPLPTSRSNTGSGEQEEPVSLEDQLAEQVSDLQQRIERKQEDLEAANSQMEGYKSIAQEAETALQESVETYNTYEAEMTRMQEEKDATIVDLQRRVEEISSELVSSSTELTELRGQHEQDTLRFNQEKGTLDAEIARLKEDVADYKTEVDRQTEYVKSQADIATRARQDYEQELAKHGETMKTLRTLRDDHNAIKSEIGQFKAQAEAARAALDQNEDHWKTLQSRYESQIIEANRSQEDLKSTNKALLKQFDEYKAQIDNLKSSGSAMSTGNTNSGGGSSSNLEELIAFLRREKEIKEVECSMAEQEAKRVQSQLSQALSQLDATREKLHAAQATAQNTPPGTNLQALQNQIEQINVFRESNTTLRNDAARLEARLTEKTREAEDLQAEIEPLRTKVTELEGELELSQGYHKQADTAREYWQDKYNNFFTSNDRVAPEDYEKLKKQFQDIEQERDQAVERVSTLEENIKTMETGQAAAIEAAKDAQKEEFKVKFNKRHKQLMEAAMATKQAEIDTLTTERDELRTKLASLQQDLDASTKQLADAQSQVTQSQQRVTTLEQEVAQLRSQLEAAQHEVQSAQVARKEAQSGTGAAANDNADVSMGEEGQITEGESQSSSQEVATLQKALDDAKKQLVDAQNRAFSAENECSALQVKESLMKDRVAKLEQDDAEKSNRIVELQSQAAPTTTTTNETPSEQTASAELEKVRQELVEVQKALDEARAKAKAVSAAENEPNADANPTDEQTAAAEAALKAREAKLKELEATLEQREIKVTRRESQAATIKDAANNKIKEIRQTCNAEVANLQAELASLKQEKQSAGNEKPPAAAAASAPPTASAAPKVDADDREVREFFSQNKTAQAILRSNVSNRTNVLTEQLKALRAENATLKAQEAKEPPIKSEGQQSENNQRDVEAALAKAKAEHDQTLKKALEKAEQMHAMKAKMKDGMLITFKTRSQFVEKAVKETPTEEVAKVWPGAVEAGNKAKEHHAAEEKRKTAEAQAAKQGQPQSAAAPAVQPAPQMNGAKPAAPAQLPKPTAAQRPNAATPTEQPNAGAAPTPMRRTSGMAPPGSIGQPQTAVPQQQQQQQAGRGRGDGMGTGPGALRGLMGNQSAIPRGGGTGIPQPGGRGRGQQAPGAIAIPNAQNPAASQIGRGGGRGGRGGARGGAQSNPASPRGSLNPGAAQFNPGAGRGQKRGAEDDGEGATRGGKRPRGRGGQGGGGVPQGGAPAAGGE